MLKNNKKIDKKTFLIVKSVILKIDLYSLLKLGLPEDEFDPEIKSIVAQLPNCKSPLDIAHTIARIFSSSFGEKFEPDEYLEYGQEIFNLLRDNGCKIGN